MKVKSLITAVYSKSRLPTLAESMLLAESVHAYIIVDSWVTSCESMYICHRLIALYTCTVQIDLLMVSSTMQYRQFVCV